MAKTTITAVAAGLLLALGATAQAGTNGYTLYQEKCAKCHGESGLADTWRGRLFFAEKFRDRTWQQNTPDADMVAAINKGPGLMPAFDKALSDEQKSALVRVIRELGR